MGRWIKIILGVFIILIIVVIFAVLGTLDGIF